MKVALISPFTPPLVGGLERVTANLAGGLQAAGHEAFIVGQFASSRHSLRDRFTLVEPQRSFRVGDVPVSIVPPRWPLGLPGSLVYGLMWTPGLRKPSVALLGRAFRRGLEPLVRGVDVVHYLGVGTDTIGFAAASAARAANVPLVVQPAMHPGHWGDRPLDAELYRRADAVIAFTRGEAELIARLGVAADRVRIVPGSVDPPPASDPGRFRRRYGIEGPIVLFVGRKTVDKGIDRLLAAWPAVRAAHPTATLVLIGPSWNGPSPAPALPAGIVDIADASEEEKHDALAACDLLCLPSTGESFCIAVFEAWWHGKPVVVADVPALRESVGACDGGRLVAPEPRPIAEAVDSLLRDPTLRNEMGARGRILAAEHTHGRTLARYFETYAEVLGRRRAG
jgi:glycosyltransferase involved in cell wall biosynthesis